MCVCEFVCECAHCVHKYECAFNHQQVVKICDEKKNRIGIFADQD